MYDLSVSKMHCGSCIAAVKTAVKSVDPRAEVTIDLSHKQVQVKSEHPLKEIIDALTKAGYPAQAASGAA